MNFWSTLLFAQDLKILLFFNVFALFVKGGVLMYLYSSRHTHTQKTDNLRRIMSLKLLCIMVADSAWTVVLLQDLSIITIPAVASWNWIRFAWLCGFVHSMMIAIFMKYITQKKTDYTYYTSFIPSLLVCCVYVIYVIINYQNEYVSTFEYYLRLAGSLSGSFFLVLPGIWYTEKTIRSGALPRLLELQARWVMVVLTVPFVVGKLFSILPVNNGFYALFCASNSFLSSIMIFVIGKRLLRLRFLNLQKRVSAPPRATFVTMMGKAADELYSVTNLSELHHIVRSFFERSFSLLPKKVHFYLQSNELDQKLEPNDFETLHYLRAFFTTKNKKIVELVRQHKVLILDELMFSAFYEHDPAQEEYVTLLKKCNANVVLPIFKKNKVIAYIVVDKDARTRPLYSNAETNEMTVFAAALGNMINTLQTSNFEIAAGQEREIRQELEAKIRNMDEILYRKTQENSQYKESIRSFLYTEKQKGVALLFYKNRRFIFANRAAKNSISINLNLCPGDPLTKALTKIAHSVEKYRDTVSRPIKNSEGKTFIVSATPSIEKNSVSTVIIIIHPPELSDLIKKQMDLLKDPHSWDYLLYLETTEVGRLVDEVLPGSSKSIINLKIELLKAAFCKQVSLITATKDDITPLVKLLHQISMRSKLYTLKLCKGPDNSQIATKLFGANRLISSNEGAFEQPLLKKLDKVGTLHIENIENLTINAQKKLTEYLAYGYFSPVSSKETINSNVRVLCSTSQNLQTLVQQGQFDSHLCKLLEKSSVSMPSLAALDSNELKKITEDIAQDSLDGTTFSELINLTEHEKKSISKSRPTSFVQLQSRVEAILTKKSNDKNISYGSNCTEDMDDPVVSQAIKLGKKTLVSKKLMSALWDRFKNYAKISEVLGVNRSSVLRRCRDYGIGTNQSTTEASTSTSTPTSEKTIP